jgi:hypothetical protein
MKLPITFEGDEPETPTPWDRMLEATQKLCAWLAIVGVLGAIAGYYWGRS